MCNNKTITTLKILNISISPKSFLCSFHHSILLFTFPASLQITTAVLSVTVDYFAFLELQEMESYVVQSLFSGFIIQELFCDSSPLTHISIVNMFLFLFYFFHSILFYATFCYMDVSQFINFPADRYWFLFNF